MNPTDEGEIQFRVGHDPDNGNVVMDFNTPVTWLAMPPSDAINLGKLLMKHAGVKKIEVEI